MIQEQLLQVAAFRPHSLMQPNAWVGHIPFAAWIIKQLNPSIFVELGTHSGNSYFAFCQSVAESELSTKCFAIDTWQGDEHAGVYDTTVYDYVNEHNNNHYKRFSTLLRQTFDSAVDNFQDQSIELLHIDGLHTYEAVRHDFETWLPKLAPNAVVLFHDTCVHERDFGVWKLWEELRIEYPNNLEFTHSHGLGILKLSKDSENTLIEWLNPNQSSQQRILEYFSALGSKQIDYFELIELKQNARDIEERNKVNVKNIDTLSTTLLTREQRIKELSITLDSCKQQLDELYSTLNAREQQVDELSSILNTREQQVDELSSILNTREQQVDELTVALSSQTELSNNLSEEILAIKTSTVWRFLLKLAALKKLLTPFGKAQ